MSLPNLVERGIGGNGLVTNGITSHEPAQKTNLIYKLMSAVMRDIGAVGKDQKNQAQGFKFRGIDQFVNALYPALTRHGVFMAPRSRRYEQQLQEVTRSSGKVGFDKHVTIEMEYVFYAPDGSSVTVGPIPAEGLDSGDKATNKALSAALKYALIQTFSIPTEDMAEGDLESPEIGIVQKTEQKAQSTEDLRKAVVTQAQVVVARKKATKEQLLKLMKAENAQSETDAAAELSKSDLERVMKEMEGMINGK